MPNYIIDPNQLVGDTLPNIYINRITLTGDNDDLGIELVLTAKDINGPGSTTQWLNAGTLPNGKTIKDFIKVYIYQATSKQASQYISQTYINNPNFLWRDIDNGRFNGDVHYSEFSLKDFKPVSAVNNLREYDKNGNFVTNNSITINLSDFNNLGKLQKPSYLSYFVWSQLDVDALCRDFGIDGVAPQTVFQGISGVSSKVNSDIVFKNNELMSEGFVFYEGKITSGNSSPSKTDKLWVGPYHYHTDYRYTIPGTSTQITYTGYMGGAVHDPTKNQPILFRQTVPNNKIQDFRSVNRIERLQLDFSSIENNLLQSLNGNRSAINKKPKLSYFTEAWMSRDVDNNCRFIFGIDLRKIVRENTPYSVLFSTQNYQNPSWLRQAMTNVKINSLKVYRKRIQGSSELNPSPFYFPSDNRFSPIEKPRKFNSGVLSSRFLKGYLEGDELNDIVNEKFNAKLKSLEKKSAKDKRTKPLPSMTSTTTAAEEVENSLELERRANLIYDITTSLQGTPMYRDVDLTDQLLLQAGEIRKTGYGFSGYTSEFKYDSFDGVATIEQINGIHGSDDIIYYSVKDPAISRFNDGFFQYRIEIDIQDNLVDYLMGLRDSLLRDKEKIVEYYEAATSQKSNFLNGTRVQESYFDPSTNRFTQAFMNSGVTTPVSTVQTYINALSNFVNISLLNQDGESIKRQLISYISKSTGNPTGVLNLINLYDQLISFINAGIGIQRDKNVSTPKTDEPKNSLGTGTTQYKTDVASKSINRSYRIEHTFSEYFNANLKNTGYDFLGTTSIPIDNEGLRVISPELWKNTIVVKEVEKIFNNPDSSITLFGFENKIITGGGNNPPLPSNSLRESDYSYFTPSLIYNGPNSQPTRLIGEGLNPRPNLGDIDFINSYIDNVAGSYGSNNLINTNTLNEKTADFLSYNYNFVALVGESDENRKLFSPGETPPSDAGNALDVYVDNLNKKTTSNVDAFPIFWSLISDGVVSEGSLGGVSLPEKSSKKLITYYDVNNPNGFFNSFSNKYSDGDLVSAINSLPNTIKALIRYNDELTAYTGGRDYGPGALKADIDLFLQSDPFINPLNVPKAKVLFDTIVEVQYLNNFDLTSYNINDSEVQEFSAKMPKWEKLDRVAFDRISKNSFASKIICRIVPWESDILKTERTPQTNLPTYEKYFILQTSDTNTNTNNQRPEPFSVTPPESPETTIGNEQSPDDSSNPMVDTIASNWDAENVVNNVAAASGPPPSLPGQAFNPPGGRPTQEGQSPQQGTTGTPPPPPEGGVNPMTNPMTGPSSNFQTNTQTQTGQMTSVQGGMGGMFGGGFNTGGSGGGGRGGY